MVRSNFITPKEKEIADRVMAGQTMKQAAQEVLGLKEASAKTMGSVIMNREQVQRYIESQAGGAAQRITTISKKSKNAMVQLAANKDILDRAGFKPQDQSITINAPLYLPPEVLEKYELAHVKKYEVSNGDGLPPPNPLALKEPEDYFRTEEEELAWQEKNKNGTTIITTESRTPTYTGTEDDNQEQAPV